MRNLFKAFLFRLFKDLTFKITLIIGMAFALGMTGLYALIDYISFDGAQFVFCTGQSMLVSSLNPAQNFGLAIPVNLISFTVLEFMQGIIRNKIIAGNSKGKIYVNLFFSGLVFSLVLITLYCLITFGLGSLIGGFDPNGLYITSLNSAQGSGEYLVKLIISAILVYVSVTSMTIFFATLFRSIGPCIPIVIILLLVCSLSAQFVPLFSMFGEGNEGLEIAFRFLNPLYALSGESGENSTIFISNEKFIAGIVCNLMWTLIFFVPGLLIFRKRDIK